MRSPRGLALACALLLAALTSSCRSSGEQPLFDQLPYHVALAPGGSGSADGIFESRAAAEGDDEGLAVDLAWYGSEAAGERRIDVPRVLGRALQRDLFSRVTVLSRAGEAGEAALVRNARATGADLLMTIEQITFDSKPRSVARKSNWFWFLTGPLVYLFNDRSFRMDGTVEVALYDLNRLDDELAPGALVRRFRAKPDWIDTRYTDRAEGGLDYVKSIFVPTSFLRAEGQQVAHKVAVESIESMARALAEDIAVDADFVVRPSQRETQFYWAGDPAAAAAPPRVEGRGSGARLVFETEVLQRLAGRVRDFREASIRVGGQTFELGQSDRPGPGGAIEVVTNRPAPQGWVRKRIRASIPIEAAAGSLSSEGSFQLALNDSRDEASRRTWTFPVGRDNVRAIEAAATERGTPAEGLYRTIEDDSNEQEPTR